MRHWLRLTVANTAGPAPVRTPEFLDGLPSNSTQQQLAVQESTTIHDRAHILVFYLQLTIMLAWSFWKILRRIMTWDDSLMFEWIHAVTCFAAQACACQFGKDWAKSWMFVSNRPDINFVARSCTHPPGTHEMVVGVRLPDGSFKSRLTAEYPAQLATALAAVIRPFLTTRSPVLRVVDWQSILPSKPTWPQPPGRVEDGGLPSTALHMAPQQHDLLVALRLRLWYRLAKFLGDPDADFLLQLGNGVLLGVNQPLTPSPGWPVYSGTIPAEVSLQDCLDSWKSAQDHPDIVRDLVQEEVDAGFIAHVPGGVPQFKQMYTKTAKTAIGKLGVVLTPGRAPRLVVDSSISNVTANTVLPNHMLLPPISGDAMCTHGDFSAADDTTHLGRV